MVIFFNNDIVRNMLLTNGVVYTLREKRGEGKTVAVVGKLNDYKIIADVQVEFVKHITHEFQLIPYVPLSGLQTAHEWYTLAKAFFPELDEFALYRVKMTRRRMY